MIKTALLALALSLPAYAQAPMVASELECGTLNGRGRVMLTLGGEIKAQIDIICRHGKVSSA